MAIDVFEVFDRPGDGAPPPPEKPQRFQGLRTAFAVGLALLVLGGLALGAVGLVRGLAGKGAEEAARCTPAQRAQQAAAVAWLGDRMSQATGATDAVVTGTGCTKDTEGMAVGALTHLVDQDDLEGAVATLREHDCEIKLAGATGTCRTTIEDAPMTVRIAPAPADDGNGDYLWTVEGAKAPA